MQKKQPAKGRLISIHVVLCKGVVKSNFTWQQVLTATWRLRVQPEEYGRSDAFAVTIRPCRYDLLP